MLYICFYARSVIRWRTPENLQDNLFSVEIQVKSSRRALWQLSFVVDLLAFSTHYCLSLIVLVMRHEVMTTRQANIFLSWAPVRAWISENLSQNIFMSHIVSSRRDRKYVYLLGITTLLSTYNQLVTTLTLSILKNWKQIAPGSSDRAETFSRKTCSRYSRS